jgi:Zn-dependent protease
MGSSNRTVYGIPIRMHWAAPLCGLLWSAANGGFHFAPGIYAGYALVLLTHELGHAALVRLFGASVIGIEITIAGGECHWAGHLGPVRKAAIAWGGVLAQFALLVVAAVVSPLLPFLRTDIGGDLLFALVVVNFITALCNLLPVGRLDGVEAWRIVPLALAPLLRRGRWVSPGAPFPRESDDGALPPLPPEIRKKLDEITKGVEGPRERA